jgi:hypothetical protein
MKTVLRNSLAVLIGLVLGSSINMAVVIIGPWFIPPPPGVDASDSEALSASIHLFQPRHFVAPFVGHALGTLAGSLSAFLIAASHKSTLAFVIGAFFLAGGLAASFMIPAPLWFIALDLLAAYIPMAWLGARLASRIEGEDGAAAG